LLYWSTRENINDHSTLVGPGRAYGVPKSLKAPIEAIYIREDFKDILLEV